MAVKRAVAVLDAKSSASPQIQAQHTTQNARSAVRNPTKSFDIVGEWCSTELDDAGLRSIDDSGNKPVIESPGHLWHTRVNHLFGIPVEITLIIYWAALHACQAKL